MDRDPVALGQAGGEHVRRSPGQLLRLHPRRLGASGVGGEVSAQGQLLQAHELCTCVGREPHPLLEGGLVLPRIGVPALLYGPHPQRPALGRSPARGRGLRSERGEDPGRVHWQKAGRIPAYTVDHGER